MPPLSLKPDASFFQKIAIGAFGVRAVSNDLGRFGHRMRELERGSSETKLWKEVKRKRVRIPDLVCIGCGLRVECRAKTKPEFSMSHSRAEAERAWDYGMVEEDLLAFPICVSVNSQEWTSGRLQDTWSYWHSRSWSNWQAKGHINYFPVSSFRAIPPWKERTKGVEEAAETVLTWDSILSTRSGRVTNILDGRITVERAADNHRHTWPNPRRLPVRVEQGQEVRENQVLASRVSPVIAELRCAGGLNEAHVERLLASVERTQRFTGVKLARLSAQGHHQALARIILNNPEEDMYVRVESAAYLATFNPAETGELFRAYLNNLDQQARLEAIIALAETHTNEAIGILTETLNNQGEPYFLRSAAAWALGKTGNLTAAEALIRCFGDLDTHVRFEALDALTQFDGPVAPLLINSLREADQNVVAGCAEALRRRQLHLTAEEFGLIAQDVTEHRSQWSAWLAGQLAREQIAPLLLRLQDEAPDLHYAITLLWTFVESWIALNWEVPVSAVPEVR